MFEGILIILITWFLSGFLAFFLNAFREGYTSFEGEVVHEFKVDLVLGYISFIVEIGLCMAIVLIKIYANLKKYFIICMNFVLRKING
jgi:hypothetical protein